MRRKIPSLVIILALFILEIYHSIDPVSSFVSGSRSTSTILSLTFHALWFLFLLAITYKFIAASKNISGLINSLIVAVGTVLIAITVNRYNLGELNLRTATFNLVFNVVLILFLLNTFKDKAKS